jgi:hypothetical protein
MNISRIPAGPQPATTDPYHHNFLAEPSFQETGTWINAGTLFFSCSVGLLPFELYVGIDHGKHGDRNCRDEDEQPCVRPGQDTDHTHHPGQFEKCRSLPVRLLPHRIAAQGPWGADADKPVGPGMLQ